MLAWKNIPLLAVAVVTNISYVCIRPVMAPEQFSWIIGNHFCDYTLSSFCFGCQFYPDPVKTSFSNSYVLLWNVILKAFIVHRLPNYPQLLSIIPTTSFTIIPITSCSIIQTTSWNSNVWWIFNNSDYSWRKSSEMNDNSLTPHLKMIQK